METIGALDAGTQSIRFCVYNLEGLQIGVHQAEFPQHTPQPGWLEHSPMDIINTAKECMAMAIECAEDNMGSPVTVKAFGITNQRETTILWDRRTGEPLYNAVVWSDTRTQEICDRMTEQQGTQDAFRGTTGLPISTYFSAFKVKWLLENVPEVAAAGSNMMFGTVDSWIIYNLTGGKDGGIHVTDVSNASRTMLLDLSSLLWSDDMLAVFGFDRSMLPTIVSNSEVYGRVSATGHPLRGVPIAGCLGDQHAALLGQRCRAGQAKNTYGSGCFMLLNTGPKMTASTHGLLSTVAFRLGPTAPTQYALEGSIAIAGLGISWLQKNLGILSSAKESEEIAREVEDTGGVYIVPAFSGLYAPYWRSDARGVLVGLTLSTSRAHIVRAMLESICFQTKEILDAMRKDSGLDLASMRVDGGACANDLLMQMQADFLMAPVVRPLYQESTAMGAAFAAGLAAGVWDEAFVFDDIPGSNGGGAGTATGRAGRSPATTFSPQLSEEQLAPRVAKWKDAVQRSFNLG